MGESIVRNKARDFAIDIIRTCRQLSDDKREFTLSRQLLRSATSIGANINEALAAISRKDFQAKMYISFKEARETAYWLDLLHATDYIDTPTFRRHDSDCTELIRMLSHITRTTAATLSKK